MNEVQSRPKLRWLALAASLFFVVSGGPNGLEDLVRQSGPALCLLLLVVTPLIWSLPSALMTAELGSALPVEGGFYIWVTRGLGPRSGFACAIWSLIYALFEVAIYPVLAVSLLKQAHLIDWATANAGGEFLVGAALMTPFVLINIFGIRPAGNSSLLFAALVLGPFGVLIALGLLHPSHALLALRSGPVAEGKSFWSAMGGGLSVCMWNYLGWDTLSTVSQEVETPQRTIPRAIFATLPVIVITYVLVIIAGLAIYPDWQHYETGIWVRIAGIAGGPILLACILAAGLASSLGQFNAVLLGASRLPAVLADAGYLPGALARISTRFGTPVLAIWLSALIGLLLTLKSFTEIVELDVLFYSAGIVLEFAALIALRLKEPDLPRPYKIPGGLPALLVLFLPPSLLVAATFWLSVSKLEPLKLAIVGGGLALPFILFPARKLWARKGPNES